MSSKDSSRVTRSRGKRVASSVGSNPSQVSAAIDAVFRNTYLTGAPELPVRMTINAGEGPSTVLVETTLPGQEDVKFEGELPTEATVARNGSQIHPEVILDLCAREDECLFQRINHDVKSALQSQDARMKQLEASISRLSDILINRNQTVPDTSMSDQVWVLRSDVNLLLETRTVKGPEPTDPTVLGYSETISRLASRLQQMENQQHIKTPILEATAVKPEFDIEDLDATGRGRKSQKRQTRKGRPSKAHRVSSRTKRDLSTSESSVSVNGTASTPSEDSSIAEVPTSHVALKRIKGPKYGNMRELKPNNPIFDRLLSYRSYRLDNVSQRHSGKETGKASDHIRRLELTMKEHLFNGEEPILILDFFGRIIEEANTLSMSEAQAHIALPYFLRKTAATQFRAVRGAPSVSRGGLSCWPEAVQYLLRAYATPSAIREAIMQLRSTNQKPGEAEVAFSTRLNEACFRCGNVYPEWEKMTLFIDGLDPTIRSIVARHREHLPRKESSFERLVQFAQDEGDACRARMRITKPQASLLLPKRGISNDGRKTTAALYADSSIEFRDRISKPPEGHHDAENLAMFHPGSIPTEDLSSTANTDAPESALPLFNRRGQSAARIPYEEHSLGIRQTRPGWVDRAGSSPSRDNSKQHRQFIYHVCYAKGHVSTTCVLALRDIPKVVENYELLSDAEKTMVPIASYWRAKAQFNFDGSINKPTSAEVHHSTPMASERHPSILRRPLSDNDAKN